MAPDHQTSERVYGALKRDLLGGALGPGKLNIAALEDRYATSATPVREALLRLVGERLVEMRSTGGFGPWQPHLEDALDLYAFNLKIVVLALNWRGGALEPLAWDSVEPTLDPPIDRLFIAVAERSRSRTLLATIASLSDRLHQLRLAEQVVLGGLEREYTLLSDALDAGSVTSARRAATTYHARRLRNIDVIVRAVGNTR